jgi:hypothetical protein
MPATPGTSTTVTVNPAIGLTKSDTKDPFFGLEAGRTYTASAGEGGETTFGGAGTDTIKGK